ncbi:MAG: Flagellar biosynthesis protein FliP [Bartonella clarridgeiae]|uniref:flagellar type III secretion system pore protein FliP n=1 Tax=Bartonella clarridgeiae TaxID=56426 RepID=UPI0023F20D00|nr:flagellar type III secretion system pore protein FliP [Bartonella clarridgeiae]WCR55265.1 MAG: Flagellar biosynthesis protein FliP [Bartonella clarridgeiae]
MKRLSGLVLMVLLLATTVAFAQGTGTENVSGLAALFSSPGGSISGRIIQLFGLLTVLSVAPGLLIMVTSFTRFAIAFSLLRTGLGLQTTPSNLVMISLALFMSFYVMAPTFNTAWEQGVQPLVNNKINEQQAIEKISQPFREFMVSQVREKDLDLFVDLSDSSLQVKTGADVDFRVLIPAFMISELRRGFEIGFLIVLPFLVIDLVVATLTMSMGMMMLPPTVISLPFKILFFVLIDGWNLLVGSLIRSF